VLRTAHNITCHFLTYLRSQVTGLPNHLCCRGPVELGSSHVGFIIPSGYGGYAEAEVIQDEARGISAFAVKPARRASVIFEGRRVYCWAAVGPGGLP